jgi:RHS repeat-associated protein
MNNVTFQNRSTCLILTLLFLSTLLCCVFIAIPVQAEVLGPGWFSVTAEPVSPQDARDYYKEKAIAPVKLLRRGRTKAMPLGGAMLLGSDGTGDIKAMGEGDATEATPEITELARALQYNPKLIYDYVHNHIKYVPYFGSLKGATLTLLDGSGNDFDQASLMIALLRASGYTASYEYGTMTIPGYQLVNWLGTGYKWINIVLIFVYGGIPIEVQDNYSHALVTRVWVKANIDGAEYRFDPAITRYTWINKIDFGQAMGYSYSDVLDAISKGATVTDDYVQNLNETALCDKLAEYSSNLTNTIRSQYPNATVEEIVSGRSIIETTLHNYQTSLDREIVVEATWDEIPPEYTATIRVEHVSIDHTFYVPEIAGKRLTVTYAGSDYHPELRLDGELVAQGTATTPGTKYDMTLTIDHPYASLDGTYCDQTSTYDMESGATYALFSAFAGISNGLLSKRQKQLDKFREDGLPQTSEEVMGESLNIMGLTWAKEISEITKLLVDMSSFVSVLHHGIGRMSQESNYYIDVKNWASSNVSRFLHPAFVNPMVNFYTRGSLGSALEHGILEQMMGPEIPGASTVKLLQVANSNGDRIFSADSANFASIRPQLQNYTVARLDQFQSDFDSGLLKNIILPENADIVLNQWHGVGFREYYRDGGRRYANWEIDGDLYGGYGSKKATVDPDVIEKNSPGNVKTDSKVEVAPVTSTDPVNMLTGGFIHERSDLSLGAKSPLGLTFSRSYNSSLNRTKRTLGYGWTHNYDIYLNQISHGGPGLGQRQPVDTASLITALYVNCASIINQDDILSWMTGILTSKWAVDQLINNAINVHLGNQVMEYVKLADGSYAPPPGVTTQLIDNGDSTFSLLERFGTRMDFDVNGRITKLTDVDGNIMDFTYNSDNLTKVTDAFGRNLNFNYSDARLSAISDSAGRSVFYNYDTNNNLTGFTDSQGKAWNYGYDGEHRMTSITNPLNITTVNNTYDDLGRVSSQTVPRQGDTTATYKFYFPGFKNIEEDPDGNQTIYFYDQKGNSIGEENALGHRSEKEYDGQNHITKYTDPRRNKTTPVSYVYDGNQNLVRTIRDLDKTTNYTYDPQFRLTDITDPLTHTTHMDYDAEHHLILTTDAEGNQIGSTYYPNGLTETRTDGCGAMTTLTYDANGHPETSRVGSHPEVTYSYDEIGRMSKLTDQAGATTSFEYDKRGLITKITDPLGQVSTFVYDDTGQLSSVTDRNGDTITYTYTPTGKVETVTYPGPTTVDFNYDQLDNLVQMQDGLGITTYTYDAINRLTSVTDPHGFTVSYAYDEAGSLGNLTTITYPGNKTVSYTYDALNRLEMVTNSSGTASYTYDDAGRLIKLRNFNGSITTYDYDDANRLIAIENPRGHGTPISSSSYYFELDGNGNRTQIFESEPLTREVSAGTIDYSYNPERNRLELAGALDFTWDNEGQLSNMDGANFSFDSLHRLVGVEGTKTVQYAYDGMGRRLKAVRDGITTHYVYDAAGNLLVEANASNEITRYYIHGLGLLAMDIPVSEYSIDTYCYHYNAIGSTIAMSDDTRRIVNKYAYTPFGEVANQTEPVPQPFKFVGQHGVMAEPNGFYYMRARYYDPVVGRFVSEDPSGFAGGDVNLYAYVTNNPILFNDPLGLCKDKEDEPDFWKTLWEQSPFYQKPYPPEETPLREKIKFWLDEYLKGFPYTQIRPHSPVLASIY